MSKRSKDTSSRREFLKTSGRVAAAASVLAGTAIPRVYAAGSDTIQLALVGCGGRGTGAAMNALSVKSGAIKIVALADVSAGRLKGSHDELTKQFSSQVDVPEDRRFLGLDAYKKAMDALKPGDVAIFATPLAFRWVHFGYAIEKGLNVFMEKPLTADGPTSRRMIELGKSADKKNLKVGVGLMSRHSRHLEELAKRVHDGEIGDIVLQRGYRMHGPIGYFASTMKDKNENESDFMFQARRFHSFLWAGGGCFSDFNIHIIDHLGWMKNAWPVKAQAVGGRHYKTTPEGVAYVDQNFDSYSVEYTYPDGTKFFFDGRCMNDCSSPYSSYLHGTKGSGIASTGGDCGGPSSLYKDLGMKEKMWESKVKGDEGDPYVNEWKDLIAAIRDDKPYSELKRGVEASVVTSMGRAAAHTGQEITFEQFLNSDHEYAPGLDKMTADSPAPLQADADGKYPAPMPGKKKDREF